MSSALITQLVIGGLSSLSLLFTWVLLHVPDPAFAWRQDIPTFELPELSPQGELAQYTVSPTHDWKGLV